MTSNGNWKVVETGEIFDLINGYAFKGKEFLDTGAPVLKIKNVKAGSLNLTSLAYVDEEFLSTKPDKVVWQDDLLISMSGNRYDGSMETWVGKVCWFGLDTPYLVNQRVGILRLKSSVDANPRFLAYQLSSESFQRHFIAVATSSGGQANLSPAQIKSTELLLPPKNVQDWIVSVAGSLEDKIQLNHQINQTLEQMAQAIFKSWFVDFEPVKAKIAALEAGGSEEDALLAAMQAISGKGETELTRLQAEQPEQYAELRATAELFPSAMQESELGEIPEGWGVDHLSELIQFNPRRSLKKGTLAPYLDMKNVPTSGHLAEDVVLREMNSGTKFVNGDTLLARITPCLENGKTAYVDFLDSDQVGWGSTEYIVMRSQEPYPKSMSYFIARNGNFRQYAIQSMTGTSGRQRVNAKALAELPWIIYPRKLTEAFDRIATPYLKQSKCHGNQSKSLSAIRDALLPKLLSGELNTTMVGA